MKIDIGDNNKIENSNIGKNNKQQSNKKLVEIIISIIITIVTGVIIAYIVYKLGWN